MEKCLYLILKQASAFIINDDNYIYLGAHIGTNSDSDLLLFSFILFHYRCLCRPSFYLWVSISENTQVERLMMTQ